MSRQIARTTDPVVGGFGGGKKCGVGSSTVLVENKMVYCVGDKLMGRNSTLISGSSKVFIGGKQVGRVGDIHTGREVIVSGSSKVLIG